MVDNYIIITVHYNKTCMNVVSFSKYLTELYSPFLG